MSDRDLTDAMVDRAHAAEIKVGRLRAEIDRLRAENLTLHEQIALLESPEVCAAAHDNVSDCGYCQRDALRACVNDLENALGQILTGAEVMRYDCTSGGAPFCQGCYTMTECPVYGDWVRAEDYDALAARVAELEVAIKGAYGILWMVNCEPGTPDQFEPEAAAYEARKLLRGLLTHEQRGEGINQAMQSRALRGKGE